METKNNEEFKNLILELMELFNHIVSNETNLLWILENNKQIFLHFTNNYFNFPDNVNIV